MYCNSHLSLDSSPAFKSRFKARASCRKSFLLRSIEDQLVMTSVVLISRGHPSPTSSVNPVSFPNQDLLRRSCDARVFTATTPKTIKKEEYLCDSKKSKLILYLCDSKKSKLILSATLVAAWAQDLVRAPRLVDRGGGLCRRDG